MEKRFVLGIDAGGTKTHYALYDLVENRMVTVTGGPANHESLEGGYAELENVLHRKLQELLSQWCLMPSAVCGAGFGMGGVDTRRQHDLIAAMYTKMGFERFSLANDGSLGIKAECTHGSGICCVNGTGFSVFGMDREGKAAQIGGLGEWTGDVGGGYTLAAKAFRAVYRQIFYADVETAMTPCVYEILGIEGPDDLIEQFSLRHESGNSQMLVLQLAKMVHACANQGDPVACQILREIGEEYARAVVGVVNILPRLCEHPLEIALVGSGFVKAECDMTKTTLLHNVQRSLPDIQVTMKVSRSQPVLGALYWGCQVAGVPDDEIPHEAMQKALDQCLNPR